MKTVQLPPEMVEEKRNPWKVIGLLIADHILQDLGFETRTANEANMEYYKQCVLRHGNLTTVAWIEERGSKVGQHVKLKDSEDPKQVWEVLAVSAARLPASEAREQAREAHVFKERGSIGTRLK